MWKQHGHNMVRQHRTTRGNTQDPHLEERHDDAVDLGQSWAVGITRGKTIVAVDAVVEARQRGGTLHGTGAEGVRVQVDGAIGGQTLRTLVQWIGEDRTCCDVREFDFRLGVGVVAAAQVGGWTCGWIDHGTDDSRVSDQRVQRERSKGDEHIRKLCDTDSVVRRTRGTRLARIRALGPYREDAHDALDHGSDAEDQGRDPCDG